MMRVLIADNYPVVRYGLKQILTEIDDIQIVDEAVGRNEVFHKVQTSGCNVLLLEAKPCDIAGLELLSEIQYAQPGLGILTIGMHSDTEFSIRAIKAGSSGHITLDSSPDEFVRAIRMVADGRRYVNSELAEMLAYGLRGPNDQPYHRALTDREYQVMCILGSGKTPTQAARALGLAKTTIATYRKRVLEKLNLENSMQIIRYTLEHKLVMSHG